MRKNLPEGWECPKLEDLVSIKYGKGLPTKNLIDQGYPVFGANGIIGCHSEYLYEEEQVLVSCRGAYSGKINWSPKQCFVTNNSLILEQIDSSSLNKKYLFYALHTVDKSQLVTGSAQPQVTINNAKELLIPIAPLKQQKRIVAEIEKQFSRLDEAVANLKRVKANLKRYKAAVLKAAVEGTLTEEWRKNNPDVEPAYKLLERILEERRVNWQGRGKYKEPVAPDTTGLPGLPEGWVWSSAEQVCDFITKGTTPKAPKLHNDEGEIRFLKVYNLTFSGMLNYNYKPVFIDYTVHQKELARSKVFAGDVLINIVGPPLGQVSVVPHEISEANINQAIARFRPIKGVSNQFLAITLMTGSIMSWAIKRAKTTAGQSNLTLELCRALPIPLPASDEQHNIVEEVERRLSVVTEVNAQVDANLRRADRLRQSILKKAFSGKLI